MAASTSDATGADITGNNKKVLLLGGNGFIGSATAELLIAEGYNVTICNRGSWPWDTRETIGPHVRRLICDRGKPETGCEQLWAVLNDPTERFDAVVDFSAYKLKYLTPFWDGIRASTNLYIYISSDSVYEVCQPTHVNQQIPEIAAVRPDEREERKRLNRRDSYGHDKFKVEEFLIEKNNLPHISLRLPDVLGERDGTERFFKYVLWLRYHRILGTKVPVPKWLTSLKTSAVYSRDVAQAIRVILSSEDMDALKDSRAVNQAYNLAWNTGRTLESLLLELVSAINEIEGKDTINPSAAIAVGTEDGDFMFPSVTRGPVDTTKFRKAFPKWTASDWPETILSITRFYLLTAMVDFPNMRDEAARSLLEDLDDDIKDEAAKQAFWDALWADADRLTLETKKSKQEL